MSPITLYILSVLISFPLIIRTAIHDFGCVTIGGLIPLTALSLIPVANIPIVVILWVSSNNNVKCKIKSIMNKRIFERK